MRWLSVMRLARLARSNVDRQLSRNDRGRETGAIAVIVGMFLGSFVLLGVGALVIDTGSLLYERRQLQSGADAAALSIAQTCAKAPLSAPCAAPVITNFPLAPSPLVDLAGANAADGKTDIASVCGSAALVAANPTAFPTACTNWLATPAPPDPGLTECPRTSSTANYVEVRTSTRTNGGTILPPVLSQMLAGANGQYSNTTVKACARVAWGPPSTVTPALPVTISICEFNAYTGNGSNLQAAGPYVTYPSPNVMPGGFTYEKKISFHTEGGALTCPQGPSGADEPGGFGYLESAGCDATISATSTVTVRPGNPSNTALGCDFTSRLSATTGNPVFLPIYTNISGGKYTLDGVAAFWLTGFSTSGNRHASDASSRDLCTNSQTCLYGWFTSDVLPIASFGGGGGGGTARGAIAVGVTG